MRASQSFPGEPASVGAARRFVTACLPDLDADLLDSILVMVSELAANSVRHAGSRFEVALAPSADGLRVAVTDWGDGTPAMRSPQPSEPTGRGLRIVDALADRWGVESQGTGKTVWFTVPAQMAGAQ